MIRLRLSISAKAALLATTLLALLASGCQPRPGSNPAANTTVYTVGGIIRELKPDGTNVVIKHDPIPGYMEAMTMNFDATNATVLRGLKRDDVVRFQFHVTADDSWVDGFQVLSNAEPAAVTPGEVVLNDPTAVSFFKDVPELTVGDELPNYTLTNQLGKVLNLTDYRGRVLAFTFIFTRCPMPDFCPRMTARFRSAQNTLKELKDAPDWQLLSLSIDPLYDKPRVLKEYGRLHDADPARWTLATGAYEQLQPLGTHFGLTFAMNVTPDKLPHNLRTVVIDRSGKVHRILIGNDWNSDELVKAILDAGAN